MKRFIAGLLNLGGTKDTEMCIPEDQQQHPLEALVAAAEQAGSSDLLRGASQIAEALWLYQYAKDVSGVSNGSSNVKELSKNLLDRAQSILHKWRQTLKEGDTIHCPDFMDEYEFNDESLGFVKLYAATIQKIATGGSNILLGDSACSTKTWYQLEEGERAIFVNFVDYPDQSRWIVLKPHDPLAMNVIPLKSHEAAKRALQTVDADGDGPMSLSVGDAINNDPAVDEAKPVPGEKKPSNGKKTKRAANAKTSAKKKKTAANVSVKTVGAVSPSSDDTVDNSKNRPAEKKREVDRKRNRAAAQPDNQIVAESTKETDGESVVMDVNGEFTVPLEADVTGESRSAKRKRKVENEKSSLDAKPAATKPKQKKSSRPNILDFTWICTECNEAECDADPDAELMLCEGGCHRPFHYPCANLSSAPPADQDWVCEDCQKSRHRCVLCDEYGADNVDVFCCDKEDCGLFFHESCLSMQNVEIQFTEEKAAASDEDVDGELVNSGKPHFICAAHTCWACTEDIIPADEEEEKQTAVKKKKGKGRKKKNKVSSSFAMKRDANLYRCLHCPIAYHLTCIPPLARFHELALLCHEHAGTHKLPDLDLETSMQAEVEASVEQRIAREKRSVAMRSEKKARGGEVNHFFPGVHGDEFVTDEDRLLLHLQANDSEHESLVEGLPFCLPCDIKNEVHSKPPSYHHVYANQYDKVRRPKRKPPSDGKCDCKAKGFSVCDESCINRTICIECVGDVSKAKGEKSPYANCDLGPSCTNRALGRRQFTKCKPMREQGKGWGLVTLNALKKGDLVIEYVGEVIDEKEKEDRLTQWTRDHPNDPNFYVMALETGWYLDARLKANLSRFINHSCAPNCRLLPMNVNGYIRVGIYTLRDIAPGEFLSYDYQFDTKHGDKFRCRCGAVNCRGTMKGGKGEDGAVEQKSRKEEWQDAKAAYDRDVRYLEDATENEQKMSSQVDYLVPGAENATETVAAGPNEKKYRNEAVNDRIFLWRNVVQGDVSDRPPSLRVKRKRENTSAKPVSRIDMFSVLSQSPTGEEN